MMTRRTLIGATAGANLIAQTAQELGKRTIDAAVEALGGQRFLTMKDRIESGRLYSFYREELRALAVARIYTRYLTRPEPPTIDFFGLRERQSFGKGKEDYAVLFTETDGWQITFRGARPLGEEVEDRFRDSTRRNILYILRQRLGEPGMLIEHLGSDVMENQPVDIVNITDSENFVVKVYFHRSTHLPVKQEYFRRDEKTRQRFEEVTRFGKYREADGVQWPLHIQRIRDGEKIFEIFSESVQVNQNLTDVYFTLSTDMKVLPKAR